MSLGTTATCSRYAADWLFACCKSAGCSRREAQQISLLILKETSEAVSEALPAEEFPGVRVDARSRKVHDFPLICREEGLGRLPFEFACFWIKHQRAALSTRMTVVPINPRSVK
jgi:hypothetical protein